MRGWVGCGWGWGGCVCVGKGGEGEEGGSGVVVVVRTECLTRVDPYAPAACNKSWGP